MAETAKILPVVEKPMIDGYLHHAYHFSILQTEYEKTAPYIMNNYIQLTCRNDNNAAFDYFGSWELLTDAFTWKQFDKEIIGEFKTNLRRLVTDRINNEYYLWFWTDEYYIPHRPSYKKVHYIHTLLVYGYDLKEDSVNVLGFTDTNDFSATKVPFENLIASNPIAISYLQINRGVEFKINPQLIATEISDYLHPENIKGRYFMWHTLPDDYLFGVDAVKWLGELARREKEGKAEKDFRFFYILSENKKLMKIRIDYLLTHGFMSDETLLSDYQKIEECASNLKRRYFKYFLSDNKSMLDSIIDGNIEVLHMEDEILPRVIADIEKTCKL